MSGRIAPAVRSFLSARRRAIRWVLAAGVLIAVFFGAVASLPLLLNGEATKAAIERQLTALTGGDFRYATLDLSVWPRPTAELRHVTFRVAPVVDGAAERVVVRVALLPLLTGEVRVSTIRLERPALTLRLPDTGAPLFPDDPVASYREAVRPVLAWLAQNARGLRLSARGGTIDFQLPDGVPLKLDTVTFDGRVSSDAVDARIAAHSNLWEGGRAHARIDTDSLAASFDVALDGLEAAAALESHFAGSPVRWHPGAAATTLVVETDGQRSGNAQLAVAMPALGLSRNGARIDFGAFRARLEAIRLPGETTWQVKELALGDLLPAATGSLKVRPVAGGTVLEAALGRLDAGRVLAAAMKVAGDVDLVRAVAGIVRGGTALDVKVAAAGDDATILADPFAYDVSMVVEGATFEVPVPPMVLNAASGSVHIARDVLTARGVAATFGGSSLRNGEMVLALAPEVALRSISMALDIDLGENHARAERLLHDSALAPEIGRIESIAGRAKGTLAIVEAGRGYRQIYDVTSLDARIRHSGVPLPIAVDRGGLRYETGGALLLRGLAGAIGTSRVDGLDAEIGFASGPVVRSASGIAVLALDELTPWVISLPVSRELRGELDAMQGTVGVKLARLAGPVAEPGRMEMEAVLTPQKVRVRSRRLPGGLAIDGGSVRVENRNLAGDGVGVAMQDMRGTLSGSLRGYSTPSPALDVSIVRATIGPRGLEWAQDEAGVARGARLRGPIRLDRARVRWPAPAPWRFDVTAAASFPGGARSDLDLSYRPGSIEIRLLTLKDQDSDARVTLAWQPERAGFSFHGVVSGRSIARILSEPPSASGTMRGDFEATVDLVAPVNSRATGKVQGTEVGLPELFELPLVIDRIALDADGGRVRVQDTLLHLANEPLTLNGSIARSGVGLVVEGDIGAESVDAQRWLDRLSARHAVASESPHLRWPLRGRIGLRARNVDILGYRMEPFVAAVTMDERNVTAEVTAARICGIDVPFTVTATGEMLEVKGRAAAKDLPVATTVACLASDLLDATGTMDVSAEFAAQGAPASLASSTQGTARVRARDGRVGRARALSGVLKLDDVNARLSDAGIDSARGGLSYGAIEIDARLAGERAIVDRALIESPALNIVAQGEIGLADGKVAMTGIALPIVNSLLRRVPIVGRAVGDPIVGIPFTVSGDIRDPQVSKSGASAIAGALVNTLQSVVSLPIQLLGVGAGAQGAADAGPPSRPSSGTP
jgi:AsmA-like C-terminal region